MAHDLGEVAASVRAPATGVGAGEQQQVRHQPAHAGRRAQRRVDHRPLVLVRGGVQGGLEQLEIGEDAGQRRTQLVGGVGDEFALLLHRRLAFGSCRVEGTEHLLQGVGQLADLVVGLRLRHASRRVACLGDPAGGRGKRGDRPHRSAGDRHPGQAGKQRAAEHAGGDEEPESIDSRIDTPNAARILDVPG